MNQPSHLSLVSRILNSPDLVQNIQSLPARSMLKIIHKVGLEDSAEILSLATTEQISAMLDADLWKPKLGEDQPDLESLTVWLGALTELGTKRAAGHLANMDEEFLAFLLSQYINAIDLEALNFMNVDVIGDSWSDPRLTKLLDNDCSQELAGALLLAKPGAPWEYLQPLLLDLDSEDQSLCARIVYRLQKTTEAKCESEGGLYEVLSQDEMLQSDASFSRDQRRTKEGYVSTADAKAFLAWIKVTPREKIQELKKRDPVSQAYFREYEGKQLGAVRSQGEAVKQHVLLQELLQEEEGTQQRLLIGRTGKDRPLVIHLQGLTATEFRAFQAELGFLAQVLISAARESEDELREVDAVERAIEICEIGLQRLKNRKDSASAIQLFALGSKKE
jgi:hypothetical protein